MPDVSEQVKERANRVMSESVEEVSVKIVNEFYVGKDAGRKAELTNSVRISLNRMANRIEKAYNGGCFGQANVTPAALPTLKMYSRPSSYSAAVFRCSSMRGVSRPSFARPCR